MKPDRKIREDCLLQDGQPAWLPMTNEEQAEIQQSLSCLVEIWRTKGIDKQETLQSMVDELIYNCFQNVKHDYPTELELKLVHIVDKRLKIAMCHTADTTAVH